VLLEKGEIARPVSMQSIRAWLLANPDRVGTTLNANPSYVFFRVLDLPAELGPIGSLGVPLTPGRSVAVDPAVVPLGLPVYVAAPGVVPRVAFAQDTGGAIRGVARADLFTGTGPEAGEVAGRLAAPLSLWVLLPNLPQLVAESPVTLPLPTLPPLGSAR
jgi:membrane-bound lytic murein transglycosylase A